MYDSGDGYRPQVRLARAGADVRRDDRVDSDLFLLATQAWGFLDATLDGLRMNRTLPEFASRMLLVYFGARIYGRQHRRRDATSAEAQARSDHHDAWQYDYFLKMLYYDTYHSKPDKIRLQSVMFRRGKV